LVPEDRPDGHETGSWKLLLRVVLTCMAFVRGAPRPRRPAGEPETWKLALWLILFFALWLIVAQT
jgi:hypothetical protein